MKQNPKSNFTKDIATALKTFASDNYLPLAECAFEIKGATTYVKNCHMDTFAKYSAGYQDQYNDNLDEIINEKVVFQQLYNIAPFHQKKPEIQLDYTLNLGAFNTHPTLILEPTSVIPFTKYKPQELFKRLIHEINCIKAKEGMMIGYFSDNMIIDLKALVKKIYTKSFTTIHNILLFNGVDPEMCEPSSLELIFEQKKSEAQISEVDVDECIVNFTKAIYGNYGFNAKGKRVSRGDCKENVGLDFDIDEESIKTIEDETSIKLYARRRGYVTYDTFSISISNHVKMKKINRVHQQIAKDEDNDIEIHLNADDITQDSVGEGSHLTSETINISGFVGTKAVIEASQLTIDGATHNGAQLFAKEAKIKRHKGVLRCHKAEINLLEGGEVHATYVHIDIAHGGVIYGDHIHIKQVKNNVKVYATGSITVDVIKGEDNHFMIDYKKVPIVQSRLKFIEEDIRELKYFLEEARRHDSTKVDELMRSIHDLNIEIETIKNAALHASVEIKNSIDGLNIISFILPTRQELTYRTTQAKVYSAFFVQESEENYILKPINITLPKERNL